jgi:hypothetical protein
MPRLDGIPVVANGSTKRVPLLYTRKILVLREDRHPLTAEIQPPGNLCLVD